MISLDGIELPDGLRWQADLNYCPIKQEGKPSITGRLVLNRGRMKDGRPIVLTSGNAWAPYSKIKLLSALRLTPTMMQLSYHGTIYNVRWDYADAEHFVATPLVEHTDEPTDDDIYLLPLIKLIEVLD
ncbi:hypothetical protein [Psychromonas sp. MME2]|uniref:hypothetical protein n=1 Tax=unclassified Psychromonas TaxID=2614957 RepID=UPI00339C1B96